MQEPVPGISATPDESNARFFHVLVSGPSEVILNFSLKTITIKKNQLFMHRSKYWPIESEKIDSKRWSN